MFLGWQMGDWVNPRPLIEKAKQPRKRKKSEARARMERIAQVDHEMRKEFLRIMAKDD
jgi:hypothetical protein